MKSDNKKRLPLNDWEDIKAIKITIQDEFPLDFFRFKNLEELYVEGSCKFLPDLNNSFKKLKLLSIRLRGLKGSIESVFNLPSLENLKVIETPLKSFMIPSDLGSSSLVSLTIKNCSLKELPENIFQLEKLTEINFSGNDLSGLPSSIQALKNLRRLNLDQNRFKHLPGVISYISKLKHLSIDQNLFSQLEKDRIERDFHITII